MDALDDFLALRRRNDDDIQSMAQTIDAHSTENDDLYDRIARLEEIIETLTKNEEGS